MRGRVRPGRELRSAKAVRLAGIFGLLLAAGMSVPLRGGGRARESEPPERFSRGRFRIELCGGFAAVSPDDLNLFVDYSRGVDLFQFDRHLDYLQSREVLSGWTRNKRGRIDPLSWMASLGLRARYSLTESLSLTLGATYLNGSEDADSNIEFLRTYADGTVYREDKARHPFSVSARGFAPMLGILFEAPVFESVFAGLYLAGGPLFADCRYKSDWDYQWSVKTGEGFDLIYADEGRIEQEGRGTGAALELGLRVGSPLSSRLDFFCEGGYALLIVSGVSGPGKEILADGPRSWDGDWAILPVGMSAAWGELLLEIPTSDPTAGNGSPEGRDFKLDLSGFKLRMGLSFRF